MVSRVMLKDVVTEEELLLKKRCTENWLTNDLVHVCVVQFAFVLVCFNTC